MKNKLKILIPILLIICSIFFIYNFNYKETPIKKESQKTQQEIIKETPVEEQPNNYQKQLQSLREEYNNDEIIALLEIPNFISLPIVQTSDNNYYLHYNLKKEKDINGATYLDYRNNLSDRKLLIYGHSDPEGKLPFASLPKYNNQTFQEEHKYIYLYTEQEKLTYEVFASYIENKDFDYVNLNSFNGLSFEEHINKLKNKSFYQTDIKLSSESNILILQTCSFDKNYSGKNKFQLVLGAKV